MKILLVDDNEHVLLIIAMLLEADGCDVVALNRLPLLQTINDYRADVLVVDWSMPGLSRGELLHACNAFAGPSIIHIGYERDALPSLPQGIEYVKKDDDYKPLKIALQNIKGDA